MAKQDTPLPGRVVKALAGRDEGLFFVIISISGEYALIADGKRRRLAAPKRKKLKHLALTPYTLNAIADKLKCGAKVFDTELYSALRKTALAQDAKPETQMEAKDV